MPSAELVPGDHEHLARHPLIALVSAFAVLYKAFADLFDGNFVRIRPIGARLHLAFDLNAECIGRLLA